MRIMVEHHNDDAAYNQNSQEGNDNKHTGNCYGASPQLVLVIARIITNKKKKKIMHGGSMYDIINKKKIDC